MAVGLRERKLLRSHVCFGRDIDIGAQKNKPPSPIYRGVAQRPLHFRPDIYTCVRVNRTAVVVTLTKASELQQLTPPPPHCFRVKLLHLLR